MKNPDIKKYTSKLRDSVDNVSPEELKKLKKRAAAGGVAVATAVSLIVSGAVQDPADLVRDEDIFAAPAPIVQVIADTPEDADDDGGDEGFVDEEKKRGGIRNRIRSFLMQRSTAVRMLLCAPLWALGWLLTTLASLLGSALSPVAGTVLSILLAAAVILAVLIGTVKTVMPDVPVRKLLTKKNLCLSAALAAAAELVLVLVELFAPSGERVAELIRALLMLSAVLGLSLPVAVRALKKEKSARTQLTEAK